MNAPITKISTVILVVGNLVACGHAGVIRDIDRKSTEWAEMQVASYEFTATYECFCDGSGEPIRIRVQGDTVETSYARIGGEVEAESLDHLFGKTIDEIFTALRKDIKENSPRKVSVDFDPEYGFPASVEIDYHWLITDSTYNFYISDFEEILAAPR